MLGRYAEAERAAASSGALLTEVDTSYGVAYALAVRGKILTDLGAYEGASAAYEKARRLAGEEPYAIPVFQVQVGLALVCYLQGDYEVALSYAPELVEELDATDDPRAWCPFLRVWAWLVMGHVWLDRGEFETTGSFYERARAMVEDPETPIVVRPKLELDVRAGLARLAHVRGDAKRALAHVQAIIDALLDRDINGALEPMRVYLTCYQVLHAAGDARAVEVLPLDIGSCRSGRRPSTRMACGAPTWTRSRRISASGPLGKDCRRAGDKLACGLFVQSGRLIYVEPGSPPGRPPIGPHRPKPGRRSAPRGGAIRDPRW
ncbi:MAG: tetratricopeptide repeat protein [Anaerolineae bacterium]